MRGILITAWAIFLGIIFIPNIAFASSIDSSEIFKLTNQKRYENNLKPLSFSFQLKEAAFEKAKDMAEKNYWSHETPDGKPFYFFIENNGYDFEYAGENLAADFENSQDIFNAFMDSEIHRKNILNRNYEDIGVATYEKIVVVMFGKSHQYFPIIQKAKAFSLSPVFENPINFIPTLSNIYFGNILFLLDIIL